ncbi:MAG: sigma-70 family RNA polymerase sigma factor [Desulfobacca sp.]|nr:sigma-70 family RNA polymerase sigma factor [Desulfobacca sp.]
MDPIDLDYALLRKTAQGEARAFAELMQRHQVRVFRLAYRLLRDRLEAEDATQEVFLKVYQHAGSFKPTGSVSGWLSRITANHCLNRLRSRAAPEISLDAPWSASANLEPLEILPSSDPTPLQGLEEQELAQRLQVALDALPENQRQALVLKRFGDFSYQEIAEILGLSSSAVDGLIKRARNNLKKALQDYLE